MMTDDGASSDLMGNQRDVAGTNEKSWGRGYLWLPGDCCCVYWLQMTGRYAEYAEELARAVGPDFRPNVVKEF